MTDHLRTESPVEPIDPIRLTRQLCEIESTTSVSYTHLKERVQHGTGDFAYRDNENPLVVGEIDGGRSAAVGDQAMQRLSLIHI